MDRHPNYFDEATRTRQLETRTAMAHTRLSHRDEATQTFTGYSDRSRAGSRLNRMHSIAKRTPFGLTTTGLTHLSRTGPFCLTFHT